MYFKLSDRTLIKISGSDSGSFLQSQLTNDINKLETATIQFNAYCQHQGKVLAILWLFKIDEIFYISIPTDLSKLLLEKFNVYKLMSKVNFEDLTNQISQYGLIDATEPNALKLTDSLSILVTNQKLDCEKNNNAWGKSLISSEIPDISLNLSEKFIPQDLNLDINEIGVSFSKGCYPGQEVVARMHYLGKPKRRLFQFISKFEVFIGDEIHTGNSSSLKSSGMVIRATKFDENYYILGTLEVKHDNDNIFLRGDISRKLTVINA